MGPLPPVLPSSLPRTEAAFVAPAPSPPPEPPRPNHVGFRAGAGVGLGYGGLGGTFFGQVDAFPLAWLGVGLEGEIAGVDGVSILSPADSNTLQAARGRAALRWLIHSRRSAVMLGAAVGVGPGVVRNTHYVSVPCAATDGSCDDGLFGSGDYEPKTTERGALSTSLELSLRVEWRAVELGGFLRYEIWEEHGIATLGPTLGVGF